MKKITDFIVNKRYLILGLFLSLAIFCAYLSTKVHINYDITKYLPATSETRIGMDIMNDEFESTSSSFNIMFENLSEKEKEEIYDYISNVKDVSSVDYENTAEYNKDNYTLYVVNVEDTDDSPTSQQVYKTIKENYKDYEITTSGDIALQNEPVLHTWIAVFAVICALIILVIMCESYIEPFLYLTAILIAVLLNDGTNIMFSSVSNITSSISAILQMALSMDYSIMLNQRYQQEKKNEKDKVKAMKSALYNAFKSISSSSVTTIVGLIVLIFMSFTIGRDLGFVLAKGVLFSLISIFFCLPSLLLACDNLIEKTHKKVIPIKMDFFGKNAYRFRYLSLVLFLAIFGFCFLHKGNLGILYTGSQNDKVSQIFVEDNQMAIIYENKYEEEISKYCKSLEEKDKVKQVLCYGNTINDNLKYSELNDKLSDLGADVKIDDYLLKIIYYNYYNKDLNVEMTLDEFINFITTDVYNNDDINGNITDEIKNNIDRLKYFSTIESLSKQRTKNEIANILEIDESTIEKLMIFYNSKNNNETLSLEEFINFIKNDVLTNEEFSKNISQQQIESLNRLVKFTDKSMLEKTYDYKEMSSIFGIDEGKVSDIYLYYILNNDISLKLKLNDFANFVLNSMVTNEKYSSNFDEQTISSLTLLSTFSNKELIQRQSSNAEINEILGISNEQINNLKLLKYMNQDNGTKLTISELLDKIIYIKNNTSYLDTIDLADIETIYNFKNNSYIDTPLPKTMLYNFFDENLVNSIYTYSSLDDTYTISPHDFINLVLDNFSSNLDKSVIDKFTLLKNVLENNTKYSATEMSNILPVEKEQLFKIYALVDYTSNNTSTWTISVYEVVSIIVNNNISLDDETLQKINLLNIIMQSTLNEQEYTYQELSSVVGIDEEKLKQIYSVYISTQNTTKLSPSYFVKYILETVYIKQNLSNEEISSLKIVSRVITDTLNNKKYTSNEISSLLGINKDKVDLLYGLYKFKNSSKTMSLRCIINFIISDVINNDEYKNNFNDNSRARVYAINDIVNGVINNKKYNSSNIYNTLSKLSNLLDKNMIDILYIYYGSKNDFNDDWTLTVEKLVSYVNDDILKDERFSDYIKDDMRKNIVDAKNKINDAKTQLIGKKHSRVVLNTKFEPENDDTFEFIEELKEDIDKITDKTSYVIGDSPMALEMSKTFNSELDFITILTMISIFIVVALTFKSVIIPLMLVLIIQCSVYLTMGVLAFQGDPVYFISLIIVQCILMGATIDYAIVYTSYYLEHRKKFDIKQSIIESYNKSIHTILTSASILIIVTLIVGNFASAIAAKICKTISIGTLCSTILILVLLPGILATFDKVITRKFKNIQT